jgi:hypothetical protein
MTPKQLRECRWMIPSFELEDGRVLTNSTMRILNVNYDVVNRVADVVCEFREITFPVVRGFAYPLQEDSQESISAENVQEFVDFIFPDAIEIQ